MTSWSCTHSEVRHWLPVLSCRLTLREEVHNTDSMRGSVGSSSTIFTFYKLRFVPFGNRKANLRSACPKPSFWSTRGILLLYWHVCIIYLFCLLYRVAGNRECSHQSLLEVWNSGLSTALCPLCALFYIPWVGSVMVYVSTLCTEFGVWMRSLHEELYQAIWSPK